MDKSSVIFGNPIDKKTLKKAQKSKDKFIKQFGDDSEADYKIGFNSIDTLDFLGIKNIVFTEENEKFDKKAVIIGNIRMGFGHYRISIAMASAAKALGYNPYWLDLASFDATGSKMIRKQNDMYSMASKISQKSHLFNHFIWEPLNSEGFKKITYNAKDQKNSELLVPIFKNIDKDIPLVATHVWPSQGAIHAGMKHVVNAIPDNWPMGLHLSEGAIHTVQTPFAYLGYKMLNGFAKKPLKGISEDELKMTGAYIDHELLVNLDKNNEDRLDRLKNNKPLRILVTVGGAGAGLNRFAAIFNHLKQYIDNKQVLLLINFGDHQDVYENALNKSPWLRDGKLFGNNYQELKKYVKHLEEEDESGVISIFNNNIFEAVYSTNLLMPQADLLVTKPSELAYYPLPKLFMRHIGGHEVYGAINSQEKGDGTFECATDKSMANMLDRLLTDKEILEHMVKQIGKLKEQGFYNGAYEVIKLAVRR